MKWPTISLPLFKNSFAKCKGSMSIWGFKVIFLYLQLGWIVQLVRFQLCWILFWYRWNQLSWNLSHNIFVLLHCFTKSFLIGYDILSKPITTMISANQNYSTRLKTIKGYIERYPNHMIQLVGKCQLGWLGRMYESIICLHPLGWFYN